MAKCSQIPCLNATWMTSRLDPNSILFHPWELVSPLYCLYPCWHSGLLHCSQNDPLNPVYSKALSSSQRQMLPGNHFRRAENQVANFPTTTPLLSTEFLISVFHRCDQILDKKQLKRRLMLVPRSKECYLSIMAVRVLAGQFGSWRWPGEENGTRQCCSCFSLFAFLSSAESQPMELRVSFPLHLCPRQNPHGWTHRYVWWLTHRCTQRYVW